jgi:hypothetical protein
MSKPIRTAQIMEVPKHFDLTHFRAETPTGRKFVYCPVGNICSWNYSDFARAWCAYCKKEFIDL